MVCFYPSFQNLENDVVDNHWLMMWNDPNILRVNDVNVRQIDDQLVHIPIWSLIISQLFWFAEIIGSSRNPSFRDHQFWRVQQFINWYHLSEWRNDKTHDQFLHVSAARSSLQNPRVLRLRTNIWDQLAPISLVSPATFCRPEHQESHMKVTTEQLNSAWKSPFLQPRGNCFHWLQATTKDNWWFRKQRWGGWRLVLLESCSDNLKIFKAYKLI